MAGRTLGHYKILSLLGAGGMGEVYLAQDTRLGRNVALKLLPAEFTEDEERVRRFQQEARAASALNHPNIITVYDIGHDEGQHYIAAEFIDGETMRLAINSARVELNKLLELLAQVADGLAKAHASGIVHRDLKPDNIMITRDGFAKVLDFGLAKLVEAESLIDGDPLEAATALVGHTQHGVVMGTAGYMSPEQAEGRPADHRSDVFSFGCILYQAVTRRKPFEGDTFIDILHKLVHTDPVAVVQFNPRCPAELQRIIRKCLSKDPNRRYQGIKDAAIDLRALIEDFEREPSSSDQRSLSYSSASSSEGVIAAAPTIEVNLSDDDPAVARTTRFSMASVLLAILAVAGAAIIGPAYQRTSIDSEFRLECPKVVALSKAREIVTGFGYDPRGLEDAASFDPTELNLKRVVAAEGPAAARKAVGEGRSAVWKILLARQVLHSSDRTAFSTLRRKPGEFIVWIDPRGRLVSFTTAPREDQDIPALEREQAIGTAEATVKRMFSTDPDGYDLEFIKKSNPPGVVELTWRNQELVFGHREVLHVDFQGPMITRVSRSLEPPQNSDPSAGEKSAVASVVDNIRGAVVLLTIVAAGILGVVFLIRGKRWSAIRRRLPLAASIVVLIGIGATFWGGSSGGDYWLLVAIFVIILSAILSAVCFFAFAGLFEWLRAVSPARLYAAEQLVRGRFLSRAVGASLVIGSLAGALAAGLEAGFGLLKARVPGYWPSSSLYTMIGFGSPMAFALVAIAGSLAFVLVTAVIVELTQRLIAETWISTLIPALLLALASAGITGVGLRALLLNLVSSFLVATVLVQVYRSRGFLALFVLTIVVTVLELSTKVYYVGDPGMVLQASLMLGAVALFITVGLWAYVREPIRKRFSAFGLG
jgi:serine/threonine protein kinase